VLTAEVCNILPVCVKQKRQNDAGLVAEYIAVTASAYHLRAVLARNLTRLMEEHTDRSSPAKLSQHSIWPIGSTKAGKKVSERQIRYVLEPHGPLAPSATLDLVTALANAFKVPPWRLLADDSQIREWAMDRLGPAADEQDAPPPARVDWGPHPEMPRAQLAHKKVKRQTKKGDAR
jgi:hypothetical protein